MVWQNNGEDGGSFEIKHESKVFWATSGGALTNMSQRSVILVQAFDAHAGSQRVAAQLAAVFRSAGMPTRLWLGFGTIGFVSDARPDWRFCENNVPRQRKILYIFWLVVVNIASLFSLFSGRILWANSIAAVPAAGAYLLFAPRLLVIHCHEDRLPKVASSIVAWAGRRGSTILAVSDYHARQLGFPCQVLRNAVAGGTPPDAPAERNRLVFVGSATTLKGFPLFVDVARLMRGSGLIPTAFLAGDFSQPTASQLAEAAEAGITVSIGETSASRHHADGFLLLQMTDPALWDETFSLVAAEALWHLVPVGGAGSDVLNEVAGQALAFNDHTRSAETIAANIRDLLIDGQRYANLVAACSARRGHFSMQRFSREAVAVAEAAGV